jgi:formiminotetrahydrofolate cyclodeaminase
LAVVETGVAVVALAARIAERGNLRLRGDAVTAALLAEAGARAAAVLVLINLEGLGEDTRRQGVAELIERSAQDVARARRLVER